MTTPYLIGYDIAHPRRLGRLHRRLKGYGIPIQYSLFLCSLTETRLAECVAMIEEIINPREDDVRLYPLPTNYWSFRLGRAVLPDGIVHTDLPASWRGEKAKKPLTTDPAMNADFSRKKLVRRLDATTRKLIATTQTGQKKGLYYIP
ncbi:CRISPR-associated endonuclease Cas2 [Luteithermobacter gelatinilyticus]|uniref:CRISPR-associated endonuclease Cas2 n=1 Tax=Luteithermobacter gelatinilyticus TaxID=2582913 RepID=UPI001106B121|nr:CRISPR-associated endonuclease Cas2 [Luteithermobacter gelatinilyticus]